MRCYYMSVSEFYFEHRIGQYLNNGAFALDYIAFSQNNSSLSTWDIHIHNNLSNRLAY